ncbi:MAG: hypothetical protein WBH47_19050, partial [Streptosporangiaceae bacterium]
IRGRAGSRAARRAVPQGRAAPWTLTGPGFTIRRRDDGLSPLQQALVLAAGLPVRQAAWHDHSTSPLAA